MSHTTRRIAAVSVLVFVFACATVLFVPSRTHAQVADDFGTGASAAGYCPDLTRTLQRGARDATTDGQVSELQRFLADHFELNADDAVTGFFGALTQANVILFQREQSLPAFGIVGSLTRARIAAVCATPAEPTSMTTTEATQSTQTSGANNVSDPASLATQTADPATPATIATPPTPPTPVAQPAGPVPPAPAAPAEALSIVAPIPTVHLSADKNVTNPGEFWTLTWSAQGSAMTACEMTARRPDGSSGSPFDPFSGYVGFENANATYPAPVYPANTRSGSIHAQHTQAGVFIFSLRCRNANGWSGVYVISHQVRAQAAPSTTTPAPAVTPTPATSNAIPTVTLTQDIPVTVPGQFWTLTWTTDGTALDRCEMTAQRPDGSVVAPFDPYSAYVDYQNLRSSYPAPAYPTNHREGSIHFEHTQIGIFIFTLRCHNASGWSGVYTMTHQVRAGTASMEDQTARLQHVASALTALEDALKSLIAALQ